eukprot:scaffold161773_cov27-Prasinocladus_malaysianus.AAC.1
MPLEFIELLAALQTFCHGRIEPLVYSQVHMKAADISPLGFVLAMALTLITLTVVPLRCAPEQEYEYEYPYEKILQ